MFGSNMTSHGRGSQRDQHNHRLLRRFAASPNSLPKQWAHGQQRTRRAESFARQIRRNSGKLARETPKKTYAVGAQPVAWMAAGNQRLGSRLQKQSSSQIAQTHCGDRTAIAFIMIHQKLHRSEHQQPPDHRRTPWMPQKLRHISAQWYWTTAAP